MFVIFLNVNQYYIVFFIYDEIPKQFGHVVAYFLGPYIPQAPSQRIHNWKLPKRQEQRVPITIKASADSLIAAQSGCRDVTVRIKYYSSAGH
jgi:hypothetical protein